MEIDERRSNNQKLGLDWVAASSPDNQSSARTEKGFEQSLRDFELKISFSGTGYYNFKHFRLIKLNINNV